MHTADLIAAEARRLPEHLAEEALDFVRFLQTRGSSSASRIDVEAALRLLDIPPLDLGGECLSRDECHDRSPAVTAGIE